VSKADQEQPSCTFGALFTALNFFLILALPFNNATAQERCATVPYTKQLQQRNILREDKSQFEEWLRRRISERRVQMDAQQRQAVTYRVPVIVHVVHNGEPVGTGSNISDEQILSQIAVLNRDFRRLNADAVNTPAAFLPVAGSLDIEFVLAKQTPEGQPTTGIVRVQGTQSEWTVNDSYELKSLSYWPAEDYLNIWVTTLASSYVGFAQFPVSGLPGLENSSTNRLTDGLVIHYDAFGSIEDGDFDLDPQYNKGRTTTHEMGHFFGLRHIWGDDESESNSCSGTDYVDDTPNQSFGTNGCPTGPRTSCGTEDMYMNFLDYTNDACMNLFTAGQVERMITVLENSPRRVSLLTSHGLLDPEPVANNLGIKNIITPAPAECSTSVTPVIEVQNYGTNTVTSTRIRMVVDGVPVETQDFNISVDPQESTTVSFSSQALSAGAMDFQFEILLTNGVSDAYVNDNLRSIEVFVPESIGLPFSESFATLPSEWTVNNPDGQITWQVATAPSTLPSNTAPKLNFYEYEDGRGELDLLTTPIFDLSSVPVAYLSFDVSHARFQGSNDRLRVYVLTDCDGDLFNAEVVYDKSGDALATVPASNAPFTPSGADDWRREIIDLSPYLGETSVQLAFAATNDWGNNLYLDNIAVITNAAEDLALKEIVRPAPVQCDNAVTPELKIQNTGTVAITSFNINMTINDGPLVIIPYEGSLAPGAETTVTLDEIQLNNGMNTLSFALSDPNGLVDLDPNNNASSVVALVDRTTQRIPFREDFDNGPNGWISVNPESGMTWTLAPTNSGQSAFFNAFDNPVQGDEAWLVSPVLDFSGMPTASLFFDVSYAANQDREDRLRIVASTDCGATYPFVVYDEAAEDLPITSSTAPWSPSAESDWVRKFVPLNQLAGNSSARIAFVFTNANGNNIYIDSLEFFASDEPNPTQIEDLFLVHGTNPSMPGSFYITFNLEEPGPVGYEIIDVTGRTLVSAEIRQVLNQTFLIDAGRAATGIYILRLRIGDRYYATRVFLRGP
jgi:hypothetical protein